MTEGTRWFSLGIGSFGCCDSASGSCGCCDSASGSCGKAEDQRHAVGNALWALTKDTLWAKRATKIERLTGAATSR